MNFAQFSETKDSIESRKTISSSVETNVIKNVHVTYLIQLRKKLNQYFFFKLRNRKYEH